MVKITKWVRMKNATWKSSINQNRYIDRDREIELAQSDRGRFDLW